MGVLITFKTRTCDNRFKLPDIRRHVAECHGFWGLPWSALEWSSQSRSVNCWMLSRARRRRPLAPWWMCALLYKSVICSPLRPLVHHPLSPLPRLSLPLSNGRRGVTRRAAEDQRHAGGDPEENGQPVQTGQHLHHWRVAAPGRTQLRHQQVRHFSSTPLVISAGALPRRRSSENVGTPYEYRTI